MGKKIILCLFFILPVVTFAETVYESQTTGTDRASRDKLGQIFTATGNYTPTKIELKLFQDGGTVSSVTTKIYTYTSGDPDTGTEICTGTLSSPALPSYPSASELKEVNFECSQNIYSGNEYSFVITSNLTDGIGTDANNSLEGSWYKFNSGSWGEGSSALYYQIYGNEAGEGTNTNTATGTPTDIALGSIVLGLGIIITLVMILFVGFIFNRISSKKPWKY